MCAVSDAVLGDGPQVGLAVKGADAPVGHRHGVEDRPEPHVLDAGQGLVGAEAAVTDFLGKRPQGRAAQCSPEGTVALSGYVIMAP